MDERGAATAAHLDPPTTGWDERGLLLLGVLMGQDQHGYQINEFIERALCRVTTMKKPTAYALLDRLASGGYVTVYREQAGNRPPRKVYSITPTGEELFRALLRKNLATVDRSAFEGDVGLMLLAYLEPNEALTCLHERLAALDVLLADQSTIPPHGGLIRVDLALDHLLAMRRADRDWLTATIARLERDQPAANGPS